MHKILHPRDDADWLYELKTEGRRGLASIQDSFGTLIQRLEDNIKKRGEILITASRNNRDNVRINRTKNN